MITRGTTPYHSFVLPLTAEQISAVYITYLQNNQVILDKSIEDVTIEDIVDEFDNTTMNEESTSEQTPSSQITLHLTQEDTLKFHFYPAAEKNIAVIQLRIVTNDGEAYASKPISKRIFGVLKDGVI